MNSLTKEMKIANCLCCTLAPVMRDCESCPFNEGLIVKALRKIGEIESPYPVELKEATLKRLKTLNQS